MMSQPDRTPNRCTPSPHDPRPRQALAADLVTQLTSAGHDRSMIAEVLATALLSVHNNRLDPARYECTVEAYRRSGWGLGEAIAQGAADVNVALDQAERYAAIRRATALSTMTRDIAMRAAVRAYFAEQADDQAVAL